MSSRKKSTGISSDVSLDTSTSTTGPHYYDKSQDLSSEDVNEDSNEEDSDDYDSDNSGNSYTTYDSTVNIND